MNGTLFDAPKASLSQFRSLESLVCSMEAQVRELRILAGLEPPEPAPELQPEPEVES